MDHQALKTLLDSEDWRRLPFELALDDDRCRGHGAIVDRAGDHMVEMVLWRATQYIALLFDTYGQTVQSVGVVVTAAGEDDGEDPVLCTELFINGKEFTEVGDAGPATAKVMQAVDGCAVADLFLEGLADIHHPALVANRALLTGPLSGKYLSAEHARVVGRTQAPTIDAWVGKRVLTAIAEAKDAPNHPAAPKLKF